MQPLRDCRRRQLLSLADLAAASGVSQRAIGAIERGLSVPRLSTIRRISDVLDIEPWAILEFARALEFTPDGTDGGLRPCPAGDPDE